MATLEKYIEANFYEEDKKVSLIEFIKKSQIDKDDLIYFLVDNTSCDLCPFNDYSRDKCRDILIEQIALYISF